LRQMRILLAAAITATMVLTSSSTRGGVTAVDIPTLGVNGDLNGMQIFPPDNPWNTPVDKQPVDPMSSAIIAKIGPDKPLIPEFGASRHGGPHGFPYVVVGIAQRRIPTYFDNDVQSDTGSYPIPNDAPVEIQERKNARRMILLSREERRLYEISYAYSESNGWKGNVGAIFDLMSNQLRPDGWASADDAGLPIFPGLVRFDEVHHGAIDHALRFTVSSTRAAYVPPARHWTSRKKDKDLPPMGMRVRLKAGFDISKFPPEARVILKALKTYGMMVGDNGDDWGLSGTADSRWNDMALSTLSQVKGSDFEVVETKGMVAK